MVHWKRDDGKRFVSDGRFILEVGEAKGGVGIVRDRRLADDGKRCVQPLNVAGISFVGRDGVDTWGRRLGGRGLVAIHAPR